MRYYVMEPLGNTKLPAVKNVEGAEVVLCPDLNRFCDIDYDLSCRLISERLKLLIEMYLLSYDFVPVIYMDVANKSQLVFFRFKPPIYNDCEASYRKDGVVSWISFSGINTPTIFTVQSPKGICSVVVSIAVAESALRRQILGVDFNQISD